MLPFVFVHVDTLIAIAIAELELQLPSARPTVAFLRLAEDIFKAGWRSFPRFMAGRRYLMIQHRLTARGIMKRNKVSSLLKAKAT
jgi:hypothetical protein